jgi:hypothetical protein
MAKCTKLKEWSHQLRERFPQGEVAVVRETDRPVVRIGARQFEAGVPPQQVTPLSVRAGASTIPGWPMDIEEAGRYDAFVGAKHDVGMSRDRTDTRLVWIELRVEVPKDVLAIIVDGEGGQPVQIEDTCHDYE